MIELSYPLSVLAKAVAFRNLSAASLHVGLSQPQLSRMIAKLEQELGMQLLNRQVKRKSSWTPQALQLAELFQQNQVKLDHSIRALQANRRTRQIHIGTLEGLAPEMIHLSKRLFDQAGIEMILLDIFDRSELEAKFLAGDLDLICNTRIATHAKPRFVKVIGYQSLDALKSESEFALYSSFEFNLLPAQKRPKGKTIVSNSLQIRRDWMKDHGGSGSMPSAVLKQQRKGLDEVLLIGGDWLDQSLWQIIIAEN